MWARLGRSWENVPKFFLLREFERCISEFGGAAICSTDFGERSHKAFKQQARFTSRQASTMTAQVRHLASFCIWIGEIFHVRELMSPPRLLSHSCLYSALTDRNDADGAPRLICAGL